MSKKISVRIDDDHLYYLLREAAFDDRKSINAYLVDLVREKVEADQ